MANFPTMKADILILGGGVLGLWTLRELRRRDYEAYLIDIATIGNERSQSGHALWYLHLGFDNPEKLEDLLSIANLWEPWYRDESSLSGVHFIYHPEEEDLREEWEEHWKGKGLLEDGVFPEYIGGYELPEEDPAWLSEELTLALISPECSLPAKNALELLCRDTDIRPFISKVQDIKFDTSEPVPPYRLELLISDQSRLCVTANTLLLTAGSANVTLTEKLGRPHNLDFEQSDTFTLAIEGPERALPNIAFVRGDSELHMFAKKRGNRTVWLASKPETNEDKLEAANQLWEELCEVAPWLEERIGPDFRAGIYRTPRYSFRGGKFSTYIDGSKTGGGIYTLNINYLTEAPFVAQRFVENAAIHKDQSISQRERELWEAHRDFNEVSSDRWASELRPWKDFFDTYLTRETAPGHH